MLRRTWIALRSWGVPTLHCPKKVSRNRQPPRLVLYSATLRAVESPTPLRSQETSSGGPHFRNGWVGDDARSTCAVACLQNSLTLVHQTAGDRRLMFKTRVSNAIANRPASLRAGCKQARLCVLAHQLSVRWSRATTFVHS